MEKKYDFGQFLLSNSYINAKELTSGLEVALKSGEPLGEVLVRMGFLPKVRFEEAVRKYLGISEISLTQVMIDPGVAALIPEEIALRYTLIPFERHAGILRVAMLDPTHERALRDVRMFTGLEVEPVFAKAEEIQTAIRQYLTVEQSVARLSNLADRASEDQAVWLIKPQKSILTKKMPPRLNLFILCCTRRWFKGSVISIGNLAKMILWCAIV